MIASADARQIANPWQEHPDAYGLWVDWWEGKIKSRGQTPSEMFLWFLVTRNKRAINDLIATPAQMQHLPIAFRGSTEEVLDIYCAQLRWTDTHGGVDVFPAGERLITEFGNFALWIEQILGRGLAGVSVDKYKQIALLIAALVGSAAEPGNVSDDSWDAFGEFIRTPRQAGRRWLQRGYPEQKGRWGGDSGQYSQCNRACELTEAILNQNP